MIETKVTCRGFSRTESIHAQVSHQVEKLEKFYKRISRCEVTVELCHRHKRLGQIFHVQIVMRIPNKDIAISREPERDQSHEDFSVALRDAFRCARRKLEDQVRIERGFVKKHKMAEPSSFVI
jgi:ribosome-associated translation inhibitor RaiA